MGILNVPEPFFEWLDGLAGAWPPWLRLLLWGGLAALISMLVYRQLSSQEKIKQGKEELRRTRRKLNAFEGAEFKEAWPLMRSMLGANFRQLARVAWPATAASLPLLFLLSWMSGAYGYGFPPVGTPVPVRIDPARFQARWTATDEQGKNLHPHIVIFDEGGARVADIPVTAAVPIIHKRRWWNVLMDNPAGYLPANGPIDAVHAQLPPQQHLHFGPGWMRGWGFLFFISLLTASVGLKIKLKIA
jgi:hypothetical protein